MGGYHVAHRATSYTKYIGIASTLKLPNNCGFEKDSAATVYDGVFPEFIHGFYKNSYGLDVGVIYRDKKFKLFYHSFSNTCNPTDGDVEVNVSKRDTIELKTYLSGNKILAEAWKNSVKLKTLSIPLTSAAAQAFAGGAKINRELVIAANRHPYIPCDAYFSDTTFSKSTLTTTSYTYEKLRISNSKLLRYADEGTMDRSRYGYLPPTEDSGGYVIDTGSCDFR
ncbi:hypothetical protein Amet_4170 [Alkaliphilus metalliredigens QYMF]|uniref:Uncharacterized protein n=1 Tax=Alkaliphilus metalliredigens (strain QYMF) TaxID=293826 RepID=A6TVN3_ALKMQ|nr:hypothetical protein [Alkaliphilus metalliredigens]ABR50251.1 hypothetical protein Amet_4170 [Alkaliphilus metalliredigens QYMF]